ncbi:hypothetical protein G7078_09950 [Sphingomonas sinipercae]|uniref:SPOR domain-containing protein n=1 Tax=Sphingomonas sinipercae TaxID=2714944 RepID=A0A6G7ZQ02_9SPHN|nr:SPOR domain-containing protein [Sphingomonas sinipercae]QIL03067.1 hypothetical protein G7078_09950 [Sphingomonas sinipercae]
MGSILAVTPRASAQMPAYVESPSDALARSIRVLATSPKDFNALVAAGRASLALGDAQSAAGFYARAAEVNGNNPVAQAGIGAALVGSGDPQAALTYFARAQQLGASVTSFGCDRGLAFDLLGQQALAQTDYRVAMLGTDRDEATRRLALSQAIGGNVPAALTTLQPLLLRRDPGATRVKSLVLALAGDVVGAKAALDSMMPGASLRMDPFFRKLPQLSASEKAAAVHLGVFPGAAGSSYAGADSPGDGLAGIEELLRQPAPASTNAVASFPAASVPAPSIATAALTRPLAPAKRVQASAGSRKIWLQLASGANESALPDEFRRIRSRSPELFEDIDGYVAADGAKARLVIGPFKSREDAEIFEEALSNERIKAFSWTSAPGQPVRKLEVR